MYDKPILAVKPKKKYIHVNMHKIRANKKHGTNELLPCGARVVIETEAEVTIK